MENKSDFCGPRVENVLENSAFKGYEMSSHNHLPQHSWHDVIYFRYPEQTRLKLNVKLKKKNYNLILGKHCGPVLVDRFQHSEGSEGTSSSPPDRYLRRSQRSQLSSLSPRICSNQGNG